MRIVKRKSDNVVLYIVRDGVSVRIDDNGLCIGKSRVADINVLDHELIDGATFPDDDFVGGAYSYDGTWTLLDEMKIQVRPAVSRVQFLIAMHQAGKTSALATLRSGATMPQKIRLDNESMFERNSPIVRAVKNGLSMTDDDMDLVFRRAARVRDE